MTSPRSVQPRSPLSCYSTACPLRTFRTAMPADAPSPWQWPFIPCARARWPRVDGRGVAITDSAPSPTPLLGRLSLSRIAARGCQPWPAGLLSSFARHDCGVFVEAAVGQHLTTVVCTPAVAWSPSGVAWPSFSSTLPVFSTHAMLRLTVWQVSDRRGGSSEAGGGSHGGSGVKRPMGEVLLPVALFDDGAHHRVSAFLRPCGAPPGGGGGRAIMQAVRQVHPQLLPSIPTTATTEVTGEYDSQSSDDDNSDDEESSGVHRWPSDVLVSAPSGDLALPTTAHTWQLSAMEQEVAAAEHRERAVRLHHHTDVSAVDYGLGVLEVDLRVAVSPDLRFWSHWVAPEVDTAVPVYEPYSATVLSRNVVELGTMVRGALGTHMLHRGQAPPLARFNHVLSHPGGCGCVGGAICAVDCGSGTGRGHVASAPPVCVRHVVYGGGSRAPGHSACHRHRYRTSCHVESPR